MKDISKLEKFGLKYGKDLEMAKAFIGLCYGLGYDFNSLSLEEAVDYIEDDDDEYNEYGVLIIGGKYEIDMADSSYKLDVSFETIEEAYNHIKTSTTPKVVKLSDEYDAIIREDHIEVGCQKITYEKLEELLVAAGYKVEEEDVEDEEW